MLKTNPDARLRSDERRTNERNKDAWQALINTQIGNQWLDIEKHIGWHGGYRLNQLVLKKNDEGWLLIVKAHRNGRAYAAYLQTESLPEAYEFGGELASRGLLTWQQDKWPSDWLKNLLNIK